MEGEEKRRAPSTPSVPGCQRQLMEDGCGHAPLRGLSTSLFVAFEIKDTEWSESDSLKTISHWLFSSRWLDAGM